MFQESGTRVQLRGTAGQSKRNLDCPTRVSMVDMYAANKIIDFNATEKICLASNKQPTYVSSKANPVFPPGCKSNRVAGKRSSWKWVEGCQFICSIPCIRVGNLGTYTMAVTLWPIRPLHRRFLKLINPRDPEMVSVVVPVVMLKSDWSKQVVYISYTSL